MYLPYLGLEQCNVESFFSNPEDEDFDQTLESLIKLNTNIEEEEKEVSLNQSFNMIKWIMAKLKESSPNNIVPTATAKNKQKPHAAEENGIGTVQFHGPYQPNYGTQLNIEHLNVIVDPLKVFITYLFISIYLNSSKKAHLVQ